MNQYKSWTAHKIGGRAFLALVGDGGNVHIYGPAMEFYGAWQTFENFKAEYQTAGEGMRLR